MAKNKKDDRGIPRIAQDHANILIAKYGLDKAGVIAKLTLQKIRAQVRHG